MSDEKQCAIQDVIDALRGGEALDIIEAMIDGKTSRVSATALAYNLTTSRRLLEHRARQLEIALSGHATDSCDHEWRVVDDSYEDQVIVYRRCEICDETSEYEDYEP